MAKMNKVIVPRSATRTLGMIPFGSILKYGDDVCILSFTQASCGKVVLVRLEDGVNIEVKTDEIATILDEVTIIRNT